MKIIVETVYGKIESAAFDNCSMEDAQKTIESAADNDVAFLTIDTKDGPVVIVRGALRKSIIRIVE